MIRANLVPPETRGRLVFGIRLDSSDIVRFAVAVAAAGIPVLVLWLAYGLFVVSATSRVATLDSQLAQMASDTNDVGQLASDVKRLKEISDDAQWLKRSGQVVALRLALLGNAVPQGTWLDHIGQDRTGWHIDGNGTNLDAMSRLLSGVASASPGLRSGFSSIQGSQSSSDYSFKATITTPTPTPQPAPAAEGASGG